MTLPSGNAGAASAAGVEQGGAREGAAGAARGRRAARSAGVDPFFSFLKAARADGATPHPAARDAKSGRAIKVGEGTSLHAAAQAALAALGAPNLEVALKRALGGSSGGASSGDAKTALGSLDGGGGGAGAAAMAAAAQWARGAKDGVGGALAALGGSAAGQKLLGKAVGGDAKDGSGPDGAKRLVRPLPRGDAGSALSSRSGAGSAFDAQLRQHAVVTALSGKGSPASHDLQKAHSHHAKQGAGDATAAGGAKPGAAARPQGQSASPASATHAESAATVATAATAEQSSAEAAAQLAGALRAARALEGKDSDAGGSATDGASALSEAAARSISAPSAAAATTATGTLAQAAPLSAARQLAEFAAAKVPEAPARFEVTLSPESLGAVDVRLSMRGDAVELTLRTEHGETKQLLESGLHELRDALKERGLDLAGADVSTRGDDRGQHAAHGGAHHEQQHGAKHAHHHEPEAPVAAPATDDDGNPVDTAQASVAAPRIIRAGRVDIRA